MLVLFEELESSSLADWFSIDAKLKRYITGDTYVIEKKGIDPYQTDNVNNYVILSNNDAIKNAEGRKYCILDLNSVRKGDKAFWEKVYGCFSDEVGHAVYAYLMEIDTIIFHSEHDMPETDAKVDAINMHLRPVELFLKQNYVLQKKGIERQKVDELYQKFASSEFKTKTKNQKIEFTKSMRELQLDYKPSNGSNFYIYSKEHLLQVAMARKWIHPTDESVITEGEQMDLEEPTFEELLKAGETKVAELNGQLASKDEEIRVLKETLTEKLADKDKEICLKGLYCQAGKAFNRPQEIYQSHWQNKKTDYLGGHIECGERYDTKH
jgi:hypothetical protein